MGYTTDFIGSFELDKPLKPEYKAYLKLFSRTRRMKRDPKIAETLSDPVRLAAGLPIGIDGGYFTGGKGDFGQDPDPSVIGIWVGNEPPEGQPGLWCQWIPDEAGNAIEWDGGEKFYEYIDWIKYLIEHFLKPWGYILNGEVEWEGGERDDFGMIDVVQNEVKVRRGYRTYGEPLDHL